MKNFTAIAFLFCLAKFAMAQPTLTPTSTIRDFGEIENETTITLESLENMKQESVAEQLIYNHNGEVKDTLNNMKGVSLKEALSQVKFKYEKPKELNEFYFVFAASDGYRVVFSWNEIYNTEVGNFVFFITEMKGKKMQDLDQRMVLLSAKDIKSGRRYIKCLQSIEIRRL